jgi:hypothetical protein
LSKSFRYLLIGFSALKLGALAVCFKAPRYCRYVRFGSRSVLRRHHQEGLFLGEELTKLGQKQTSALDVGCWGMSGRPSGMVGTSLVSQHHSFRIDDVCVLFRGAKIPHCKAISPLGLLRERY